MEQGNERNDFLKIIAIVAMIFDHGGQIFFPHSLIFRIIGRIALPIFAYGIAEGVRHTADIKKYFFRLLFLGTITQVPYGLLFETTTLNILFTLAVAVAALYFLQKKNYFLFLAVLVFSYFAPIDYSIYGVLLPVVFYQFRENNVTIIIFSSALFLLNSMNMIVSNFHILGVLLLLYWPKDLIKVRLLKYFFYYFYFVHIVILFALKILFKI